MNISNLFKPIPSVTVDKARELISVHSTDALTVLDVRQPEEYTEGHLPGAVLIPVGELPGRVGELDPDKPTVVYCRSGGRGGNGTAVLSGAGFKQVWNMEGGITAWNGITATGAPEAGMAYFDEARKPEEYVVLAWVLEENARRFYLKMAEHFEDPAVSKLFGLLGRGEEYHKRLLGDFYGRFTGETRPLDELVDADQAQLMEGGVALSKALVWAEGQPAVNVLEYMVAMEANAYDRYVKLDRALGDPKIHEVFESLAGEEKTHLERLMEAFQNLRKAE